MKFQGPEGAIFSGRTYTDVVLRMSEEKLHEPRSQKSYRRAVARRVAIAYDKIIDPSDDQRFIKSLVKAGLLARIN